MALNDAILLGNAISVAIGLAIGRWRTRLEGRMDEERVRLVRAQLHLTIGEHEGFVQVPGEAAGRRFDILVVDLTGTEPKIAIMTKRKRAEEPPTVA